MKTREAILKPLKTGQSFDLLVIGGGATGCGVALDAASRGLRVALVEKGDFGSGTSAKSTKLLHGGVRYLERAVRGLDRASYRLVKEALHERGILLRIAPHLCRSLPFMVPLYRLSDLCYFLAGLKLYDLLAGKAGIGASRVVGPAELIRRFPAVRRAGLKGGVLYYDGQFDDARLNLALALTAREQGGALANYLEVADFLREEGRLTGVLVRERFSGESWQIRTRCLVNACGPSADLIRRLDDAGAPPLLQVSSGSHLVLSRNLTPGDTGLTIPRTCDGRVLFVLPWHGRTLVGTTDRPASPGVPPEAGEEDVAYLLGHLGHYFELGPGGGEDAVAARWAGLRPLVGENSASSTATLHRDHLIECSRSGLITITGGKWTTYRKMAQDTVDQAVLAAGLAPQTECRTAGLILHGGAGFREEQERTLAERYRLAPDCARHLHRSYGDRAEEVALLCRGELGERLAAGYPYLKGEVLYAVREELALRACDVLARRLGLALLDTAATREAAPAVVELLARELGWDGERLAAERRELAALLLE
ncbi:MAG TPA: FAD-dependent oxidoreductase [Geomonas sp.]|nr:FAD-dependent oxidoreductase [Geomonas sp.]